MEARTSLISIGLRPATKGRTPWLLLARTTTDHLIDNDVPLTSGASRRREPRPPERGRSPDAGASRDPTRPAPRGLVASRTRPAPRGLVASGPDRLGGPRLRRERGEFTITGVLKLLIQTLLWHVALAYHLFI